MKQEALWEHLPTDKLTIHSILLISAGKRDPATNHSPDDVNQPCQPSCNRRKPLMSPPVIISRRNPSLGGPLLIRSFLYLKNHGEATKPYFAYRLQLLLCSGKGAGKGKIHQQTKFPLPDKVTIFRVQDLNTSTANDFSYSSLVPCSI